MIAGVGVDLAEIDRFRRVLEKPSLCARLFDEAELAHIAGQAQRAAGIFCAKEAFSKALGTGLSPSLLWQLHIRHDARGQPRAVLTGELAARCAGLRFFVSITHSKTHAAAVVVAETTD